MKIVCIFYFFFFQAEDGIRDGHVTGVQTYALPISGTAIAKKARARLAEATGRQSAMLELAGGKMEAVTSEMVGRVCAAGDWLAREMLLETGVVRTICLGNIVDLVERDVIMSGGGRA